MIRVQRKRTKGYKLPDNTKCVNRGTKWGNPFKVVEHRGGWCVIDINGVELANGVATKDEAAGVAVKYYITWLDRQILDGRLNIEELRGKFKSTIPYY